MLEGNGSSNGPQSRYRKECVQGVHLRNSVEFAWAVFAWGAEAWPEGVLSIATGYVFGFEVLVGSFALVGCLMAVVSWARSIRRREHSPGSYLSGRLLLRSFPCFGL